MKITKIIIKNQHENQNATLENICLMQKKGKQGQTKAKKTWNLQKLYQKAEIVILDKSISYLWEIYIIVKDTDKFKGIEKMYHANNNHMIIEMALHTKQNRL